MQFAFLSIRVINKPDEDSVCRSRFSTNLPRRITNLCNRVQWQCQWMVRSGRIQHQTRGPLQELKQLNMFSSSQSWRQHPGVRSLGLPTMQIDTAIQSKAPTVVPLKSIIYFTNLDLTKSQPESDRKPDSDEMKLRHARPALTKARPLPHRLS